MYLMYIDFDIVCDLRVIYIVFFYYEICGFKIVVCNDEILIFNVNFFMILFFIVFDYYNFCLVKYEMRMVLLYVDLLVYDLCKEVKVKKDLFMF